MNFNLGNVKLLSTDRALIQDAWERLDAAVDRDEEFNGDPARWASWRTMDGDTDVEIDVNGDVWVNGLLSAYRDGDTAVVVGSLERVLVY